MASRKIYVEAKGRIMAEIDEMHKEREKEELTIRKKLHENARDYTKIGKNIVEAEAEITKEIKEIKEIIEKKETYAEVIRDIVKKIDDLNAEMTEKHFGIQRKAKSNDQRRERMRKLNEEKTALLNELDQCVAQNIEQIGALTRTRRVVNFVS